MLEGIEVLYHSSIRMEKDGHVIYFDPYGIKEEKNDADIIFCTHSHYDHFSEEDILKIKNEKTKILITTDLLERILKLGFRQEDITLAIPNSSYKVLDIEINTIPAYNVDKQFHPKEKNWVGYILKLENKLLYIAGDTDITKENKQVECDIALLPIGGTYTTTYEEAAELANIISPEIIIPMHYGDIVGEKEYGIKFKDLINDRIKVEIQI